MQQVLLAVDGGQSSTFGMLTAETGQVLGTASGPAVKDFLRPGGVERCQKAISQLLDDLLAGSGVKEAYTCGQLRIAAAGFGMSGGSQSMARAIEGVVDTPHLIVVSDLETSLFAAVGGQPGIVVIAGTGSSALGQNSAGLQGGTGGWGYLMGDEGSGYCIGRKALSLATSGYERRGPATLLSQTIPKALGVGSLEQVHSVLYRSPDWLSKIASLAVAVNTAAECGDEQAVAVLQEAGEQLARHAIVLVAELFAEDPAAPIVSYVGGVFQSPFVVKAFSETITALYPSVRIRPPRYRAVTAAWKLAYESTFGACDPKLLDQIESQLNAGNLGKW